MADETKNIEMEQDEDLVMLEDMDGNEIPFHYITTLEHNGKEYVYLQAVATEEDEDDGAIEIYELETVIENGEEFDSLLPVEESEYEVLYAKLIEAINAEIDDCNCGDEECSCGEGECTCGDDCDCHN